MTPRRTPFTVIALLLGGLASGCGHFTGQSAFLWPLLADPVPAAPPLVAPPCRSVIIDAAPLALSGDVSNYPLLLRLNLTNFPDIATKTEPGGADLTFARASGASLPHEIEEWTDHTSGTVWVLVDSISSSQPTTIQMCYGVTGALSQSDSTAVFAPANGFAGVWHMGPTLVDATGNLHNGTDLGTTDALGLIGRARAFDKDLRSAVEITSDLLGLPASSITLSVWVNLTAVDDDGVNCTGAEAVSVGDALSLRAAYCPWGNQIGGAYYDGSSLHPTSGPPVFGDGWKHLTYVVVPGNQRLYIDDVGFGPSTELGSIDYSGLGPHTYFGRHGNGDTTYDFGGQMDEVRVSATARSPDWIKLDFESQKPGSTLVSIAP